jgi:hypothetical protein
MMQIDLIKRLAFGLLLISLVTMTGCFDTNPLIPAGVVDSGNEASNSGDAQEQVKDSGQTAIEVISPNTNVTIYAGQPVHAILVFDNSLSMAYAPLDKSRLELAQDKARQFIRDLPAGSDVTVIPICEQGDAWFGDVYDSKEDAMDAVARIAIVDRAARLDGLSAIVKRAKQQAGTAPTKRLVVFSDMQQTTWGNASGVQGLDELGDVQFVALQSSDNGADENSWIESLQLRGKRASQLTEK